jgi:hypothetical protein
MITDSAQNGAIAPSDLPPGVLSRAASQVRQFICGLHGHDALLHFEQGRMSLQCTSCGYETPGWDLNGVPESEQAVAAPRQHHPFRVAFGSQRRVA